MVEISLVELNCSDFDALARFVDDKRLALSLAVNGALSCSRSSSAGRSKRLALGLTLKASLISLLIFFSFSNAR